VEEEQVAFGSAPEDSNKSAVRKRKRRTAVRGVECSSGTDVPLVVPVTGVAFFFFRATVVSVEGEGEDGAGEGGAGGGGKKEDARREAAEAAAEAWAEGPHRALRSASSAQTGSHPHRQHSHRAADMSS